MIFLKDKSVSLYMKVSLLEKTKQPNVTSAPDPSCLKNKKTRQAKIQRIFHHDDLVGLRNFHQATKGRYKQIIHVRDVILIDNDGPKSPGRW